MIINEEAFSNTPPVNNIKIKNSDFLFSSETKIKL